MRFIKSGFIIICAISSIIIFSTNLYAKAKYEFTLQECIKRVIQINGWSAQAPINIKIKTGESEGKKKTIYERKKAELIYDIKILYYDLLLKKELSKLANEVKSNFEKATDKAEKKLESEDPDITLQDLLKLKLGLAGAKDELNSAKYSKMIIIESLKNLLAIPRSQEFNTKTERLRQEKIDLKNIEDYFAMQSHIKANITEKEFRYKITKIYLKIKEDEESLKIARESRKISRSLMVTNLANFDFGIGEAKDLFESLFIYMRSVKNYLKKVRAYNVVVAEFSMETGREISSLQY